MGDHEVPSLPEFSKYVALNMPTKMRSLGWKDITGVSVMPQREKRIPNDSAELAGDQNSHTATLRCPAAAFGFW